MNVTVLEVNFVISEVLSALISAEFNVAMSAVLAGKVGLYDKPEVVTEEEPVIAIFFSHGVNPITSKQ